MTELVNYIPIAFHQIHAKKYCDDRYTVKPFNVSCPFNLAIWPFSLFR